MSERATEEIPGMWARRGPYVLEWEDLGGLLTSLGEAIAPEFVPSVVCAVARGGLVPAAHLTVTLGVPRIVTVRMNRTRDDARYAAKRDPRPDTEQFLPFGPGDRVLVVDDIVGTGRTAEVVTDALRDRGVEQVRVAALVRNHRSVRRPDYCGAVIDDWIIFPWEEGWHDRPEGWRPLSEVPAQP